jgi:hypothetical protein
MLLNIIIRLLTFDTVKNFYVIRKNIMTGGMLLFSVSGLLFCRGMGVALFLAKEKAEFLAKKY